MSTKTRIEAALAMSKAKKLPPAPAKVAAPPTKENPLIPLSRDLVARMPEGKEALIALRAVRDWKSSEAVRRAHGSLASYHDVLTELHAAGTIKFKGEDFMSTGTKDGADYGLELHAKWIKAGKPGKFSDFIKGEKEKEAEAARESAKDAGGAR
jgi:hypothetical protein